MAIINKNEIRSRAVSFSKRWEGESREIAWKDSFWIRFFEVFGKDATNIAVFEQSVKKLNNCRASYPAGEFCSLFHAFF